MKYRLVYKPESSIYEIQFKSETAVPFGDTQWIGQTTYHSLAAGMQALTSFSYGNGIVVAETGNE
jgi:hypothetical protein